MLEAELTSLLANAALLLVGALVMDLALRPSWRTQTVAGLVLGATAVAIMLTGVEVAPGLLLDVRYVLLALVGLFYGGLPALITAIVAIVGRLTLGGEWAITGASMIVVAALIGLLWRRARRDRLARIAWYELALFGVVVNVGMLPALIRASDALVEQVLSTLLVPTLVLMPLVTIAAGMALSRRLALDSTLAALERSEGRFQGLFDAGHTAMLVLDPRDGRILDANEAAVTFLGWPYAKLIEKTLDGIDPLAAESIGAGLAYADARSSARYESRYLLADGSEREVEVFAGPVEWEGEQLVYAMILDISERKAAEGRRSALAEAAAAETAERTAAALQEQRAARLAALNLMEDALAARERLEHALRELEHQRALLAESQRVAKIGSWVIELPSFAVRFSDEARRLWGIADGDTAQLTALLERVTEEDRARVEAWVERCRQGHQRGEVRFRIGRGDDQIILSGRGERVLDASGTPLRLLGTIQDVTDQHRAEARLRQLSSAVEQSPTSILITDLQGRIEYVNDTFVATSGYARDEVLGRTPSLLSSGKTPAETYRRMWSVLAAGATWQGEFINRRKDGREYVEVATISPLTDGEGRVTHYVSVKEDITEQKRLNDELNAYRHHLEELVQARTRELDDARQRAESANAAKSAFLANMSHEIRTPLNAIVGLSHLLLQDAPDAGQRDRLRKIDGASQHLLSIINDVLDLAKIEAGKISLDASDFQLGVVFDSVRSMVLETARPKGVDVVVDIDAQLPTWLRGDPVRLRQALLNLAGNAVKFTESGQVTLRAERVTTSSDSSVRVRLSVSDTGIGIPAERLPDIFEAFEQVDTSLSRRHAGTGLGLTITKRLAELMGGEVGIDSRVDEGTTVWLELDLEHGTQPSVLAADAASLGALRSFAGRRVLVAEDHDINRDVALALLHAAGLDATSAVDGHDALALAARSDFDLVLMDVQMPNLDGLAATRALRKLERYASVPILAMTANVFADDRAACLAAGMNDIVPKPVEPEVLYATLLRWLGQGDAATTAQPPPLPGATPPLRTRNPSAQAAALRAALNEIPGLDVARGTRAVSGDVEHYLTLLERFSAAHRADAERLRELSGDASSDARDAARRSMHALKGAAGTLGAHTIEHAAAAIEYALAAAPDAVELHRATLEHALTDLRAGLGALASRVPDDTPRLAHGNGGAVALDASLDDAFWASFEAQLAEHDTAALETFDAFHGPLLRTFGTRIEALAQQLERFDFSAALATAQALRRGD